MSDQITVQGILLPDGTIRLSEKVPFGLSAVEVTITRLPRERAETVEDALDLIRASQKARGYVPRSVEEIQAQLQSMYGEEDDCDAGIDVVPVTTPPDQGTPR